MKGTITGLTVNQLKNAIWMHKNGMVPVGGYPLEWYEKDLFVLTGDTKGYHEDCKGGTRCGAYKMQEKAV